MTIAFDNFTFDTITNIFGLDLTIQNDLQEVMGSPDGTTITGIQIFLYSGPTCSGGACSVVNADGTSTFTAPNQPYFEYDQMLAPQETSSARTWQFYLAPSVESFDFVVAAYAAFPAEYAVGLTPPDTMPSAYYTDSNITSRATTVSGPLLKNIVAIDFDPTAQLADRQLAVAKVGGTLVGGDTLYTGGDGEYYIAVASDSVATGVFAAQDSLLELTAVDDANPELIMDSSAAYLRPKDDSASGWNTWHIDPDSASGSNWGPEAIAAPLGWGCSIGDASVLIGIADHGWHDVADTRGNVVASEQLNVYTDTVNDDEHSHGQEVNSIIAATGNNGIGIAGMVWTARVARTETAQVSSTGAPLFHTSGSPLFSISSEIDAVTRAMKTGAAIVNFSYWVFWQNLHVMSASDTARANSVGRRFTRRLKQLAAAPLGLQPLLVVSAGNAAIDASTAGYPQAASDPTLSSRMIIVGASRQSSSPQQAQSPPSNTGPLVNVAAPGLNVGGLNEFGVIDNTLKGTSFSAAYVSGIAAQLASFDHTLSAASLKTLIYNGAVAGGRTWGTVPIVNSYQSLRLAAQRSGGRLCGNHVYALSDGNIYAERVEATDGSGAQDEVLGSLPSNTDLGYQLYPAHLSGYVLTQGTDGQAAVVFGNGSWTYENYYTPTDTLADPAENLASGLSHDGDSAISVTVDGNNNVVVGITVAATGLTTTLASIPATEPQKIVGAYSSQGTAVFVAFDDSDASATYGFADRVYKVMLNGDTTALAFMPDTEVWNFGMTEDGRDFWVSASKDADDPPNCTLQYRDTTFQVIERAIPTTRVGCYEPTNGAAPNRVPHPPRIVARPLGSKGTVGAWRGVTRSPTSVKTHP